MKTTAMTTTKTMTTKYNDNNNKHDHNEDIQILCNYQFEIKRHFRYSSIDLL